MSGEQMNKNTGEWQECAISNTIILIGLKTNEHFYRNAFESHMQLSFQMFIRVISVCVCVAVAFFSQRQVEISRCILPFDRGFTYKIRLRNKMGEKKKKRINKPKA